MRGPNRLNGTGHQAPGHGPLEMLPCGCTRQETPQGIVVTFCLPCALATATQALVGAAQAMGQAARGMKRHVDDQRAMARRIDELERAAREARES